MQISLLDDRNRAVAARGKAERSLLQKGMPLVAVEQRGAHTADDDPKGFGGTKGKAASKGKKGGKQAKPTAKKKSKVATRPPSALAAELMRSGVVRIDGALSPETIVKLRVFVDAERESATADVESGRCRQQARFSEVALLENRCDLLMPLHGPPVTALHELLGEGAVLGNLLSEVVGDEGILQELACLISMPGSEQQPLHPDTYWTPTPSAYTAFVALQDVDEEMGPTVYLPGTHTREAHTQFYGGDLEIGRDLHGMRRPPVPEEFLRSREVRLGTLKAGDIALYNQQVLHCGSANESEENVRRIFYLSVRNPAVAGIKASASIRTAFRNQMTLGDVRTELRALDGQPTRVDSDGSPGLFEQLDAIDMQEVAPSATDAQQV